MTPGQLADITLSVSIQSSTSMHHYDYTKTSVSSEVNSGFMQLQIQAREIALDGLHSGSTWPPRWTSPALWLSGGGLRWLGWSVHSHPFSQDPHRNSTDVHVLYRNHPDLEC